MMIRWLIAGVAALALALLTLNTPLPWPFHRGTPAAASNAATPDGAACDASGKTANLNFVLKDINNRDVRLADFKGKVIVLDFWATWCEPCKIEIPAFVDLQTKYGSQGLQMIGISIDDKVEQLRPFADQFRMNYPVLQGLDHEEVQDAFGPIFGIPVTVVIGRDGRICRKHTGMAAKEQFEREIKSLL